MVPIAIMQGSVMYVYIYIHIDISPKHISVHEIWFLCTYKYTRIYINIYLDI